MALSDWWPIAVFCRVMVIVIIVLLASETIGTAQTSDEDKQSTQPVTPAPQPEEIALERPSAANAPVSSSTPDRWLLMKALQGTWEGSLLDDSRMQVCGWIELGATFGTAPSNNLPLGFNYRDNNFSLQQSWLRIQRTVVTSGTDEPTFGFRSDWILPGTDYRYTVAHGLLSDQLTANNGQPNTYGIDPVQFYAEAFFPTIGRGLDIKVGRFYAQYGVESIEAPTNALFSHSYSFLDNPYTQTGIVAALQLTPEWSVQSGVVIGQDVFFDGDDLNYIGGVKWADPDGHDSVTCSWILGSGRYNQAHGLNNANIVDLVLTHKFSGRFAYSFESLGGSEMNVPHIGTGNWLGIVNYLTYDLTPRLSVTTRLELWDDAQGVRTGFPGLYSVVTSGVNFHPRKDLVFRPEVRYDYNNESQPFQGEHGLFTVAMDVILRW